MPFLIAAPLHLEIPLGSERVLLPVLFGVVGVSVAPFLSAIVDDLTLDQIGGNLRISGFGNIRKMTYFNQSSANTVHLKGGIPTIPRSPVRGQSDANQHVMPHR